jgi:hypothetical protein
MPYPRATRSNKEEIEGKPIAMAAGISYHETGSRGRRLGREKRRQINAHIHHDV